MAIIMRVLGAVIVILAAVMAANVDAKIYERCELAEKLEQAGLNSYGGYSIGDCETPVAPSPARTQSHPPHSDSGPLCHFLSLWTRV